MASGSATSTYTARFLLPDLMERGRANDLACPVYLDGAVVAPSGGTLSVFDPRNVAVLDGATVTVGGDDIARYEWTPASSLSLSEGWRVEWTLTLDGDPHLFRNDGSLVRNALYPVVTDQDLYRRARHLDPSNAAVVHSLTDFADYREEAWVILNSRLIGKGNRPNLIMSPTALREVHVCLTLSLIYEDFETRFPDSSWADKADMYRERYTDEWQNLNFTYDADDDGQADSNDRRSPVGTIWLMARR